MKPYSTWNEGDWIAALATLALVLTLALGAAIAGRRSEEFAGHPRGLYVLFYAEMWERFSYYGMRALLILYLTRFWLFSDGKATLIYGAYTALVFVTPVLGGYLADRWLGQRKAVVFGGVLLALGHALMAVEGVHGLTDPAVKQADPVLNLFWLALALISVGSGFLKANISVIVGQLYRRTDGRRDPAYTIFYVGVNVGAALGSILVGYLGETVGWAWGFGAAGIGMVAGLLIFLVGTPALRSHGEPPLPLPRRREAQLYGIGLLGVAGLWLLLQYQQAIQPILIVAGLTMLAYTLREAWQLPREARERIYAILFLVGINPLFWALYEQAGGSLSLYTDRFVDRSGVPASLFQSVNPIYLILLGPPLAVLWERLARRGADASAPVKFALGIIQLGLGFLVFVWGARSVGADVPTPVIFVFLIYLLHTAGELFLSPVGLSAMTRLAPAHLASFFMGAFMYTLGLGNYAAGLIGAATGGENGTMSQARTLDIYTQLGWAACGLGAAALLCAPLVKRWMHLDSLRDEPDREA
ncbi:MAG: peptide transporter [Novosphingobium sp.]|nr:peptide transporter [Novosphingobium sp.]